MMIRHYCVGAGHKLDFPFVAPDPVTARQRFSSIRQSFPGDTDGWKLMVYNQETGSWEVENPVIEFIELALQTEAATHRGVT